MNKTLLSFLTAVVLVFCCTLTANADNEHKVTWDAPTNGSIVISDPATSSTVSSGDEVAKHKVLYVNVVPAAGYYLTSLTANGEDITADRDIKILGDTQLAATFEAIPSGHSMVRYPSSPLGDVEVYNGTERVYSEGIVANGSNVTVTVKPNPGVTLGTPSINGSAIENGASVTVNGDIVVSYGVENMLIPISYQYDQVNGQIICMVDGSAIQPGVEDDLFIYTTTIMEVVADPAEGYIVEKILVNGVEQPIELVEVYNPIQGTAYYYGSHVIAMGDETLNITAAFKVDDGSGPGVGLVATPVVAKVVYDGAARTLAADEDVMLYNTAGQVVMSVVAGETVSLDGLADGIYVVKGATTAMKIVK